MSNSRSVVTVGASRKRKERELSFDAFKKASTSTTPPTASANNKAEPNSSGSAAAAGDNRLLAGYLAHEFLTKGTLFGQRWDPARAEAAPVASRNPKARSGGGATAKGGGAAATAAGSVGGGGGAVLPAESYADVARLLRSDGAHVPGIVNPTQLARWLQM